MNSRKLLNIAMAIFLALSIVSCQRTMIKEPVSMAQPAPECTDISDQSAGDFLDVNLRQLAVLANEAYQQQDYEKATKAYLELLRYNITDATSIYNLACCYGLLGNGELAAQYLERAVKAGFDDVSYIENDSDFDKVRETEAYSEKIGKLKEISEKNAENKGELIFLKGGAYVQARIHFPEGYDPAKSYPLLLGLHGFGDTFENFTYQWRRFENPQFIYVALQAPYAFGGGKELRYTWNIPTDDRPDLVKETAVNTQEIIARVVEQLRVDYSIENTYLLGFSQGSFFALSTGIQRSDIVNGVICFGGWLNEDVLDEGKLANSNHLRVFLGHGNDDNVVPYQVAKMAEKVLTENGYSVMLETFDGGHAISGEALKKAIVWMNQE